MNIPSPYSVHQELLFVAAGILLSLLGFGLWLMVDLPPVVRSLSRRAAASLLGSAALAAAYHRVEFLGVDLGVPPGVRSLGWVLRMLGTALLLFSVFIEIPLRLWGKARQDPGPADTPGSLSGLPATPRESSLALPSAAGPKPVGLPGPILVTSGTYALCRHPGVLWLTVVLAGGVLHANRSGLAWLGLFWLVADVLHVAFQDRIIFPMRFGRYRDYQRTTPFLIPTRSSVRRFIARERVYNDPAFAEDQ